jgi:DNA-binding beta-propeller fold protein YncE
MSTKSIKIAPALTKLLEGLRQENGLQGQSVIFNFRDPNYSAETGGYHPVEIMVEADGSLVYVTDFTYVGQGDFAELTTELNWDFRCGEYEQLWYGANLPLHVGAEMFGIWQKNFLSYYGDDVFEVEVTAA